MIDTNKYGLGNFVKVRAMVSTRTGNAVANQIVVQFELGEIFQSYDTIIALRRGNDVWLSKGWAHSSPTIKYLSRFLGGYKKEEIELALKEGYYHISTF